MNPVSELRERLIKLLQDARGLYALGYNECYAETQPDETDSSGVTRAEYERQAGEILRRIRVALSFLHRKPRRLTDPEGLLDENGEIAIQLADGCTIYSGWIDHDDPDALVSGDYLRLEDENGKEVLYYGADEIMDDYQLEGRRALGAFLNACAGVRKPGMPP